MMPFNIQFEVIGQSGVTPIPDGVGTFNGFSNKPSIDSHGNVVFTGAGSAPALDFESGLYRASPANVLSRVAKRGMPAPGGGNFMTFYGVDLNDVDGNNMAFLANVAPTGTLKKVFHNLGGSLVAIDGVTAPGQPYLDGNVLSIRATEGGVVKILRYPGGVALNPGAGAAVSISTENAIDGPRTILRRFSPSVNDLAIIDGSNVDQVCRLNGPSADGGTYSLIGFFPALDGDNAAWSCNTNQPAGPTVGVHKRVAGISSVVVNNRMPVPGAPAGRMFVLFDVSSIGIIGDAVFFQAKLSHGHYGIFTDLGGQLELLVSTEQTYAFGRPTNVSLSGKGVALTARGYEMVFKADFAGSSVLVRAIIETEDEPPPPIPDYDVTISNGEATLTSTRGTVDFPTRPIPATFTIDEPDGERTLRVGSE